MKHEIDHIKRSFGIIGHDKALNRAIEIAMQVAPTQMSVLIHGENGTGKESFSKIIHLLSPHKHKKLIAINCGSIPEGTIDSELFGHEKGAFTGAVETRKGYFEEADGGTIFLDEIGEMPLGTQTKLLRILEYGEFIKVGSSKIQKTHVRIIAATNVDLVQAVAKGKFREDLYYRINTVPIQIPPLRKRGSDILLLFKKFAGDFADAHHTNPIQLTSEAIELLLEYPFPGNIRQLRNLVHQISVLEHQQRSLTAEVLAGYLPSHERPMIALHPSTEKSAPISEREILYKILFDMQKDLQDLKRLLFEKLQQDDTGAELIKTYPTLFKRMTDHIHAPVPVPQIANTSTTSTTSDLIRKEAREKPIEWHKKEKQAGKQEESLLLADKEKELIRKALEKHHYKRKDTAKSLGIAERTLYRKIKEYSL